MRNLERYLDFLLVPLIGGQGVEADNLSMLLQMLDTITTTYEDALEPSSSRIHATARVARKVCARACAGGAVMLGLLHCLKRLRLLCVPFWYAFDLAAVWRGGAWVVSIPLLNQATVSLVDFAGVSALR